jgi:sortase A
VIACAVLALGASLLSAAQATWISGKALMAQYLLSVAWEHSLQSGSAKKPWRWADVHTVARLDIPALDESLIVLNDASGEAMAFGPGLVAGDPLQAGYSTIAMGGHRDTHLGFLEHLQAGARIDLETLDGQWHAYYLADKQVVDTRTRTLQISPNKPGLVLITCYPFNASQTGGPLRMVARALPFNQALSTHLSRTANDD